MRHCRIMIGAGKQRVSAIALLAVMLVVVCAMTAEAIIEQECRLHHMAGTDGCIQCCAKYNMNQRPCRLFGNCVCTDDPAYASPASTAAMAQQQA